MAWRLLSAWVPSGLDDEVASVLGTGSLGVEIVPGGPGLSTVRVYLGAGDDPEAWRARARRVLSAHGLSEGDARLAIVDPALTDNTPRATTLASGLDAITQVIEPYVSSKATAYTDALTAPAIPQGFMALKRLMETEDPDARDALAHVSLTGGIALANAGLGAVHGLAGVIGGLTPAPHGAICGRLLPLVMVLNIRALRARDPESSSLARYAEVARIVTGDPAARPEDGANWVAALCHALQVPALESFGVDAAEIPEVVTSAQRASSMAGSSASACHSAVTCALCCRSNNGVPCSAT